MHKQVSFAIDNAMYSLLTLQLLQLSDFVSYLYEHVIANTIANYYFTCLIL